MLTGTPLVADVFIDVDTSGNNYTSFREAVEEANDRPGPSTIMLKAGTYELKSARSK
jgi:hypothetical protein